jgi:hypothetical protein
MVTAIFWLKNAEYLKMDENEEAKKCALIQECPAVRRVLSARQENVWRMADTS